MDSVEKIIYRILSITIFSIIAFVAFTLLTSRTLGFLNMHSFVVLSGSMEPTIPVGSVIYAVRLPGEKAVDSPVAFSPLFYLYAVRDIISFTEGDSVVTHRIIDYKVEGKSVFYKTMGDANKTPDTKLVAESNVLGKTLFYIPYLGRLIVFLKTLPGFLLFIVFPALVFVVFEILNIVREVENISRRNVIASPAMAGRGLPANARRLQVGDLKGIAFPSADGSQ